MAVTSLSDVIVPEIYLAYAADVERNLETNAFFASGVVNYSPAVVEMLNMGGKTFNLPFWKKSNLLSIVPTATDEGTTLTPAAIQAADQIARRQYREQAFGANTLAGMLAGSDPMQAIMDSLDELWMNVRNRCLFASVRGIVADNIANDSADLVHDITTATTTAFNSDDAIDTLNKLGCFQGDLGAIAVHSVVYAGMQKNDLIEFVRDSQNNILFSTYLGKRLIIDDQLVALETVSATPNTPVYYSIFFRPGCFQYGEIINEKSLQIDSPVLASGGQDVLVTRRVFAMHPNGFAWADGAGVAADAPTDAEIAVGARWNRVVTGAKNCGFAVMKSLS